VAHRIYKLATEASRFSQVVQEKGDSERDTLGFLPRCVYDEAAAQGKLYVATIDIAGKEHYAGHLMFGGRFPHLRVFQLFTVPECRGKGLGRALIESLVADAEEQYFITISARVAADLSANEFWGRVGFSTIRTESGGITTGRQINLRRRELNSPTLFTVPQFAAQPKQIRTEQPIFALDVNVFLDVIQDRPRGEYAGRLLTASMSGMLRLFVAREFVNELARAAQDESTDPIVRIAMALPQFTGVPEDFLNNLKRELGLIVFPNRVKSGQLRDRDKSDLTHLATTIYHSAAGFVTSDDSILRKRSELKVRYGIEILGPAELAEIYLPSQWIPAQLRAHSIDGLSIEVSELVEARRAEVERSLVSWSMSTEQVSLAIATGQSACPRHRVIVSIAETILGFAGWNAARGPDSSTEAWLAIDPIHPMAELGCDVLLEAMFRDVSAVRPTRLLMGSESVSREASRLAESRGFRVRRSASGTISGFEKYCVGRILTRRSWTESTTLVSDAFGISLPVVPPPYVGPSTQIDISGNGLPSEAIPLSEFEAVFGPVILLLPGRPIVVVPIQRNYADRLLNTGYQHSLFPKPEASVVGEKLYLSSPRTLSVLTDGAIMLFYESMGTDGGRGAIIAAAQISRTAIRETASLNTGTTRRGVLSVEEVQSVSVDNKTGLTFFNQLFRFESPVSLSRLRALGCADGANFVTARRIDETSASTIIEEGKPSVRLS
jgi:GNAT superfamily N-acetyltransferase/predicted nucleic acid-binding protein